MLFTWLFQHAVACLAPSLQSPVFVFSLFLTDRGRWFELNKNTQRCLEDKFLKFPVHLCIIAVLSAALCLCPLSPSVLELMLLPKCAWWADSKKSRTQPGVWASPQWRSGCPSHPLLEVFVRLDANLQGWRVLGGAGEASLRGAFEHPPCCSC